MAARSGILGLGLRLYPGNMQRIFNKDLTRFMQSLSRERQNRASKRKALLAGWHTSRVEKNGIAFTMLCYIFPKHRSIPPRYVAQVSKALKAAVLMLKPVAG